MKSLYSLASIVISIFILVAVSFTTTGCQSGTGEQKNTNDQTKTDANQEITDPGETTNEPEVESEPISEEEPQSSDPEEITCEPSELNVYLNDPDESGTNIRSSPGGISVMKLIKDDVNFEYFITVTESRDGWFKIKNPIGGMETDTAFTSEEGWIHGSVIAADSRNYGGSTLYLIDQPDRAKGKVVGKIESEVQFTKIKALCGKWAQIEYNGVTGWIETEWFCGNPLTTCS